MALHTPLNTADNVKMTYGSLHTPSNDLIELPVIGDEDTTHEVSLEVVYNVIYARVEETLMIIAQSLEKSNLKDQLGAGIVLTGGFTKMEGIRELAVAIFDNMPVRLAKPSNMEGLFDTLRDPAYSGAIGLLKYCAGGYSEYEIDVNKHMRHRNEALEHRETPNIADIADVVDLDEPTTEGILDIKSEIASMSPSKIKKDEPSIFHKVWQWATQLF